MKLKTLLTVLAMLCISLFVVACGGGEETTADPGTQAPGATTTKATTTKKTTTKKSTTTKVTTTTVTTTLAPDYMSKLPTALPNNETFEIHTRIGLDTIDDYLAIEGVKYANMTWDAQGIYGGSCNFGCSMTAGSNGTPNRAECYVSFADSVDPAGMKGVMWYVDFSRVDPNTEKGGPCTSITLGNNTYRSNLGDGSNTGLGKATGYYYNNGEWVQTTNVNSCRMEVPHGFKGWVYVPLTSYNGAGELYDGTTGIGIEGKWIQGINLYTDYYVYSDVKTLTFDEVLFVK